MTVRELIEHLGGLVASDPNTADRPVLLQQYDPEDAEMYTVPTCGVVAGTIKEDGRMDPVVMITRGSGPLSANVAPTATPAVSIADVAAVARNKLVAVRENLDGLRNGAMTADSAGSPASRLARALEGVDAVLAWVDALVKRAQSEGQ